MSLQKIQCDIVSVTPRMAADWLQLRYEGQRKVRDHHVERIARQILSGEWKITPDAIAFDETGHQINGQHRCEAIVRSGKTCACLVVRNFPRSSFEAIDNGSNRTNGDALTFISISNGTNKAALAGMLIRCERGFEHAGGKTQPSRHEVVLYCQEHEREIDAAMKYWKHDKGRIATPTNVCACFVLFSRIDKEKSSSMIDSFLSGENLKPKSPISLLRNRLIQERLSGSRMKKHYELALMIKAFNAELAGIPLKVIKYLPSESFPKAGEVLNLTGNGVAA